MSNLTTKEPLIGIISNSTSPANRIDLIKELGEPQNGFFNPLKFTFNKEFSGEIIPLDIQPNEVLGVEGLKKGKAAMFKAVEYLHGRGAKVICFTASTKRLPGKNGDDITKLYPDIIFTIGDNATMISYTALLNHHLDTLDKNNDLAVCIGAGFLGVQAVSSFIKHGFKNIVLLSEQKINNLPPEVSIINSLEKLPSNIKILAACSHKYNLDPEHFKLLFAENAIIIDVCVPPLVTRKVYNALPRGIQRFDAGDFFLPHIDYEFPPQILSFPQKGFWYGCFTEAIMLFLAKYENYDFKSCDFFRINSDNKELLSKYLKREEVYIPFINFFTTFDVEDAMKIRFA